MKIEIALTLIGAALAAGVLIGVLLRRKLAATRLANAERESAQIIEEAKKEADTIRKEAIIQAKDAVLEAKPSGRRNPARCVGKFWPRRSGCCRRKKTWTARSTQVDAKEDELCKRERSLGQQEEAPAGA